MEGLILKQYDSEVKTIEGERAFNVTITTNTVDRSGDIVEPKGAKLTNFKKNPVVLMAHNYQGLPIAKAKDLTKTENGITAKVIFPEEGIYSLADTVYNLYKNGFMKAWSIGFIPIKSEDIVDEEDEKKMGRGRRFKTWELLEFSGCAVPNNPNTLNNMLSKGINVEPLEEAGFITIVDEEEKAKYNCSCIKCGYKMTSDKHCKDIKCPKCGGTMRRVERPGPGEESNMVEDVITKPEETDDLIRLPVKGEEGKHKGHKIRWITVSTKEGIRGIYCIDCKKIITYVFEKKKGWTMAKAKKWMTDHEKIVSNYFDDCDWDFDNIELEEIDWEKLKASIEKEEKEESVDEGINFGTDLDSLIAKIYEINKENKELNEKIKEFELKAGAVLNAKNKSNLKNAQALIQSVLDSAGEEEGLEDEGKEIKDNKKDDTVITITDDKKEDPPKDEKTEEKTITIDEKVIAEEVTKALNYTLGITNK